MQLVNKMKSSSPSIWGALIGVVVFGSIWGLVEATLGGFLHLIHFPYKGAIAGASAWPSWLPSSPPTGGRHSSSG